MFFSDIFLVVSLMTFLRDFHVTSCDHNCTDNPEFTPTRLVVKYGDPTSASCSVCQHACLGNDLYNVESPVGNSAKNRTTILWTVDRLTEWHTSPICYYTTDTRYQCCSTLPVTVYQPPDRVSISFVNPTGPMFEGDQCTLQCTVQDVAPVEKLVVTFYRGQTALGQPQSNNKTEKKPVTEIFSLNITSSKEDDGGQFWCEAKLELGPDGPQRPPVVTSENITSTVYYKPQLKSSDSNITVAEGNSLQLNCSAVGNPSPMYNWTSPIRYYSSGSVLTIDSVTSEDKGEYTCSVSNCVGNATVTFNVDVEVRRRPATYPQRVPHLNPFPHAASILVQSVLNIKPVTKEETEEENVEKHKTFAEKYKKKSNTLKHALMEQVAHQAIVMQFILDLARTLKVNARGCFRQFFSKIQTADKPYLDEFDRELERLKERICSCAQMRMASAVEELEEEERQKRLGPGGLDPVEVYESLLKDRQKSFDEKNLQMLQEAIRKLDLEEGKYHLRRCIASGMWVPESGESDDEKEDDEEDEEED